MRRSRWVTLTVAPLLLALMATTAYLALTSTPSSASPAAPTPASGCVPSLDQWVMPSSIALGESVEASLVVSATCGVSAKPVDLVIVADESFSMTRGRGPSDPGGSQPTATRDPGGTPGPGPTEDPGSRAGSEPAFCNLSEGNTNPGEPSATPRRRRRTPTPGVPEEEEPFEPAGSADLVRDAKSWVGDFLDQPAVQRDLASDRLRIGFVSFAQQAKVKQALSNEASNVSSAASRMRGDDLSNVKAGLQEAARSLSSSSSRRDLGADGRVQILVLLSDFQFCLRDMRGLGIDKEVYVITVGFGRDYNRKNLADMASDKNLALEQNNLREVMDLYEKVLAPPKPVSIPALTARYRLADNMKLDPASVNPPATITEQLIEWQLAGVPHNLSFRVEPQDPGIHPLAQTAGVSWTDSEGLPGSADFPPGMVEVLPSTATPTAIPTDTPTPTPTFTATPIPPTATATSTPTPLPKPVYLPILFRSWPEPKPCVPEEQTIDVALVIDTSVSMQDPTQAGGQAKIAAAVEAGIEIVDLLKPSDQATIVGFNAQSHLASMLSGDKEQLKAALRGLPGTSAAGTAIDSGLRAATAELASGRHRPENTQSIILVTDGEQSGGNNQPVVEAAAAAKALGITIVTVGLGAEIDEPLLRQVANDPALFYRAPNAEDLLRIYREVARIIPCP